MTEILHCLLVSTVSGSIMFAIGSLLNVVISRRSMSYWYYRVVLLSVLMLIVPVEAFVSLPRIVSVELPSSAAVAGSGSTVIAGGAGERGVSALEAVFAVWLSVAAVLMIKNIVMYWRASVMIKRMTAPCTDRRTLYICDNMRAELRLRRKVRVLRSAEVSSPLLFGVVRPKIIIPSREFSDESLKMIFAHELSHLRHHDLGAKLLVIAAGCLHWFNPAVYFMKKALSSACELCCDETVLKTLKLSDNKDYGRLIISVIEDSRGIGAYAASMATAGKSLKRRLFKIAVFKGVTKTLRTAGVLLTAALSVCSMTVFGFSQASQVLPEEIAKVFDSPAYSVTTTFSAPWEESATPESPQPVKNIEANSENTEISAEAGADADAQMTAEEPGLETTSVYDEPVMEETPPVAAETEAVPQSGDAHTEPEPAGSAPVTAEPLLNADGGTYADTSPEETAAPIEYIVIPASSNYIVGWTDETSEILRTSVIRVTEDTEMTLINVNAAASLTVYQCGSGGENAVAVYKDNGAVRSTYNISVKGGEFYYVTLSRQDGSLSNEKLIID